MASWLRDVPCELRLVELGIQTSPCEQLGMRPGLHQTPQMVVEAAIQEDVAGIGLSILSGAHNTLIPKVMELLAEKGADDIVLFAGGIIPEDDEKVLREKGVKGIFTPGATTSEIIEFVRTEIEGRDPAAA